MKMAVQADHDWSPDWAIHPGEYVAEHLAARELSQAEFARLARLTPKLVSTIINGRNPITAETAIRLERVLGVKAYIWTGLQAKWDIHQARQAERERLATDWLSRFPVKDLKTQRLLPDSTDEGCLVHALLSLFGVGAPEACDQKLETLAVCHRQSRAYQTSRDHVFTWLMIGEARARAMNLPAFDPSRFLQGVAEIRGLTREEPETFCERTISLCAAAGVALVFEKPLSKTCLFGSARWIEGDRAVIQMSLRMKTNDHFWGTFFHEAGHIVLHRGLTFVDDQTGQGDGVEEEADGWAEEFLFGRDRLAGLIGVSRGRERLFSKLRNGSICTPASSSVPFSIPACCPSRTSTASRRNPTGRTNGGASGAGSAVPPIQLANVAEMEWPPSAGAMRRPAFRCHPDRVVKSQNDAAAAPGTGAGS